MGHPFVGRIILAIVCLCGSGYLFAAGESEPSGPEGGSIRYTVMDPADPNRVLSFAPSGTVYRSDDGGANWRKISSIGVGIWEASITHHGFLKIYVLKAQILYRSLDGGVTWTRPDPRKMPEFFRGSQVICADPLQDNKLYAAGWYSWRGGVGLHFLASNDAGDTWNLLYKEPSAFDGLVYFSLAVSAQSPQRAYVFGWGADRSGYTPFLRQSNPGMTAWTNISASLGIKTDRNIANCPIAVDPTNSKRICLLANKALYRSVDEGVSWQKTLLSGVEGGEGGLAIDPVDASRIYYWGSRDFLVSKDFGQSFQEISLPAANAAISLKPAILNLEIHPRQPNVLLAATYSSGLYRSTDSGQTWTAAQSGMMAQTIHHLQVCPSNATAIYFISGTNLFVSEDAGRTWQKKPAFLLANHFLVHPNNPRSLLALWPGCSAMAQMPFSCRSLDGGSVWSSSGLPGPAGNLVNNRLAGGTLNPDVVYAGGTEQEGDRKDLFVCRSANWGTSWTLPVRVTSNCRMEFGALAVAPSNCDIVYAAGTDMRLPRPVRVFRSRNAGCAWEDISGNLSAVDPSKTNNVIIGVNVIQADLHNPETIWIGTHAGLYKTLDGGADWQSVGLPYQVISLVWNPKNLSLYAATGKNGVFECKAGSPSWIPLAKGLPEGVTCTGMALDSVNNQLYLGTLNDSMWRLVLKSAASAESGTPGKSPAAVETEVWTRLR